jgi:hypothetical protein
LHRPNPTSPPRDPNRRSRPRLAHRL